MATFAYTGIEVREMDASIRFYRDVMGMQLLNRHPIPETGGEVANLQSPGTTHVLELNAYPGSRPYTVGDGLDHLAFEVGDVEAELARLQKLGVPVVRPVEYRERYVVAFVQDPNGLWLELFAPRRGKRSR